MNCHQGFRALAPAVLIAVTLFGEGAWLKGQTAPVAAIGTRMPAAGFMSAPGFKLSDVPSSVVSTDLDGDGKPDMVVAFANAGKVVVYLGSGMGKFQAPVLYNAGGHPVALAAVDLNGDGQPDIVTANGADGTVSVLLGAGAGKLGAARVTSIGVSADYLAASDLNGDGSQDVLVASRSGQALAILLNDSHGSLQAAAIQALGKTPTGVVTGDFNGDHHVDAAVASDDGVVEILSGGGDGTLQIAGSFIVSGVKIWSLATADFNRDGSLDLAVTQADGRLLKTFLGKGDGTFGVGTSYAVGNGPAFTVAVDVNGDGFVDLLSVNQGSNTVSVLLGKGDGSFQNTRDFAVGDGPVALVTGDFYSTGLTGLVVIDAAGKTLNTIAGKGDGTFQAASSYSGDLNPRALASGDLNGDGLPDLVVANFCGSDATCHKVGSLSIYLGQASGGYLLTSTQAIGAGPVAVALADLNGDGNLDVVALNRGDKTLSVLLGVGDGTLREPSTTALTGSPVAVVAKDFNQDGQIDLAVLSDCGSAKCTQPGSVDVYLGGGDGSFALGASYPVSYSPSSIAAGDLNGDGVLDLVVANACGKDASCSSAGTATVLLGDAAGIFAPQADIALNNGPSSVALWSAKSKGTLNLVVAHDVDNTVAMLKGNGDGTFQTPTVYAAGSSPRSILIADLNGDGTPDVAVANTRDSTVSVLYGRSDGTLVPGDAYAVAAGPEAMAAVAGVAGLRASLVTANGNSGSSAVGTEITALLNASPNAGSTPSTAAFTSVTPSNPAVNTAVTIQVTVSPTPPDGETVTFSSDDVGTLTCTGTSTTLSGVASCTTSQLTAGSRTLNANYGGDATYMASDASPQALTVTSAPATLALVLASPSTTPTVNQSATFTATLSSTAGFTPTAPAGTITFTIGGQPVSGCSAMTVTATMLTASCTYTATSTSTLAVAATYTNDNNFAVATQPTLSQAINPAPATLALVLASPSTTPTVNQTATFTATLSSTAGFTPTAPAGTITFTIGGQPVSGCSAMAVTATMLTASCSYTATSTSTLAVAASYSNDSNFTVASQPSLSQAINPAPATLALVLASPSTTPTVNQSATYTATLSSTAGYTPTAPAGTITFTIGGQPVSGCSAMTVTATMLTASCSYTATSTSTLAVAASYTGDTNFTVASQPTLSQTINRAPATLAVMLSSPASAPTVNQSATYTATLSSTAGFTPTAPSGIITFTIGGQSVAGCSAMTVTANALTATCNYTAASAGSLAVAATYSNDNNFMAAAPGTLSQTINQAPASLALTLSSLSTTPTVNQSATYTAMISSPAGFSPAPPSGMISFTFNGQAAPGCSATMLSAAVLSASCTYKAASAGTLAVVANYSGDTNFSVATPATLPQAINPTPATLTVALSSPSTTPTVNQQVIYTATLVSPTGFTPAPPSGVITFTVTGASATSCSPTAPTQTSATTMTATCTITPLAAGTMTVVANYGGDTNFTVGTTGNSAPLNQTINQIPTTLTLSPPGTSNVNDSVTFTATLTATYTAPTPPGGSISFTINGDSTICGPTTLSGGSVTATCVTNKLVYPSDIIKASYSGDPNYIASAAAQINQTVNKVNAQTIVSANPATAVVNQPVLFTATLQGGATSGGLLPGGSVKFLLGSTTLCGGPVLISTPAPGATSSTATCQTSFASVNSTGYAVTTIYSGDTNFNPGMNGAATAVPVAADPTTLSLNSATSTSAVDQLVNFTATLSASFTGSAVPAGTISFVDQTMTPSVPLCTNVAITSSNTAACSMPFLYAAAHSIVASFTPSSPGGGAVPNFGSSMSAIYVQTVNAAASVLSVAPPPASVAVNAPVTFTATVTKPVDPSYTGAIQPSGTITFSDGPVAASATPIPGCTAVAVAVNGTAQCQQTTFSTAGAHTINVVYTPSTTPVTNFLASSTSVVQNVGMASTSIAITSSPASPTVDQAVTFAAALTFPSGNGTPSGQVRFTDTSANSTASGTVFCTTPLTGTTSPLSATCTLSPYAFLTSGPHQVTATYVGDTNFTMIMNTVSLTVSPTPTTLAISASPQPAPPVVDQQVTFAINLMTNPATLLGTAKPQGTVTLTDSVLNKVLCSQVVAADGTVPPCTTSFGAIGARTISASFASADTNFVASMAPTVSLTVQPTATTLTVTSSSPGTSPTSVATQQVTFTATLLPTYTGAALPSGSVAFTLTGDTVDTCPTMAVNTAVQPYTAVCTITFASSISGSVSVRAIFTPTALSGGANFQTSTGTATQIVQNFKPAFNATSLATAVGASGVVIASPIVTQGFTTATDPFTPSTITVTSSSPTTFADQVMVTNCVATSSAGAVLPATFCTFSGQTNAGNGNVATLTLAPTTSTPVGAYTLAVTVMDTKVPALLQTSTIIVNVVAQVATSSLSAGAATGAFNVPFSVPSATASYTFACSTILFNGQVSTAISCKSLVASGIVSANQFTITAGPVVSAMAVPTQQPQRIFAAAFLCIPFFALAGILRRKGSRTSFIRFLAALIVLAGASQVIGCGGGFITTSATSSTTGPAVGTYLVLVTAKDATGVTYDALISVTIKSATGS